jgi:hypothetical protein
VKAQVQFRDPADASPFIAQPVRVALSPRISASQKGLSCLLRYYARQGKSCFPGQVRLASQVPCTPCSVIKHLQRLAAIRLITIERRGLHKPNRYWLEPLTDAVLQALK